MVRAPVLFPVVSLVSRSWYIVVRLTNPVPWARAARDRRATVFMVMGSDSDSGRKDEEEKTRRYQHPQTEAILRTKSQNPSLVVPARVQTKENSGTGLQLFIFQALGEQRIQTQVFNLISAQ